MTNKDLLSENSQKNMKTHKGMKNIIKLKLKNIIFLISKKILFLLFNWEEGLHSYVKRTFI